VAKKLVNKDERLLLEEEREPDKQPGARPHFNRYTNVSMKMKTARR
jgi:hypothetical protein